MADLPYGRATFAFGLGAEQYSLQHKDRHQRCWLSTFVMDPYEMSAQVLVASPVKHLWVCVRGALCEIGEISSSGPLEPLVGKLPNGESRRVDYERLS